MLKEFNISPAAQDKFSIQNIIKTNFKNKGSHNTKLGICTVNCKHCDRIYTDQQKDTQMANRIAPHKHKIYQI